MKRDYIEFQDRSQPIAFLITFRTYGTWFHGDERGSVNRRGMNRYGLPGIKPSPGLEDFEKRGLISVPILLNSVRRRVVEKAIREVCKFRGYELHALNVRTNHVHMVISAGILPEKIMNALKAYGTRALRKAGLISAKQKVWARHGSTKWIWTEESLEKAVEYVVLGQGADLL